MLPQRQPAPRGRGASAHSLRSLTLGKAIGNGVAIVFFIVLCFNFSFFFSTNPKLLPGQGAAQLTLAPRSTEAPIEGTLVKDTLENNALESRSVRQIVFTSGCSPLDVIHGQVLASTARSTGYEERIAHIFYGCTQEEYNQAISSSNPAFNVQDVFVPDAPSDSSYTFGAGALTTTLHPIILSNVLDQVTESLEKDGFVMLVENNAVFTKFPDVFQLFREADDIAHPQWFGQDASWYHPRRFPMTQEQLAAAVPSASSPANTMEEWREFGGKVPYVAEVQLLQNLLPVVSTIWSRLSSEFKYMAFPIAAKHEGLPMGISGVLTVHEYTSRYENWDFADDIEHNPCNESAGNDLYLASYPFTIRPMNFTLPQWIDGRDWSFFDHQLPPDLLDCDAWGLKQPSGRLWYLASHTNGYEKVPTILRRRHTSGFCLAVRSYGKAVEEYKKTMCPLGYNTNQQISMDLGGNALGSSVAKKAGSPIANDVSVQFGTYPRIMDSRKQLHFVFATPCTSTADWQSEVLAQSFLSSKQEGRLTRVVSGCPDDRKRKVVKHASVYKSMEVYFAPSDYATDFEGQEDPALLHTFYRREKPGALRHWLQNANPPISEDTIVVLDPDFVFIKPLALGQGFRIASSKTVDSKKIKEDMEVIEGMRQYKPYWVSDTNADVSLVVDSADTGQPIAQRWSNHLAQEGLSGISSLCSNCKSLSSDDMENKYAAGAPYIVAKDDLARIVDDYASFTSQLTQSNAQDMLKDSKGYAAAAAQANLSHHLFSNLVLGASPSDEYWGFLSRLRFNPCDPSVYFHGENILLSSSELPTFMQLAQSTFSASDDRGVEWTFHYDLIPEDLFACDSWLLAEPSVTVWSQAKTPESKQQAFGVCSGIKLVNEALTAFKKYACPAGFNKNKKLKLVSPRPRAQLLVGRQDEKWELAAREMSIMEE